MKAAIIHDVGCVTRQYSWQTTHNMFYSAMLDTGVDPTYAAILYYGVRVGGPKWRTIVRHHPGASRDGKLGPDIISSVPLDSEPLSDDAIRRFADEAKAQAAAGKPLSAADVETRTKSSDPDERR